MSKGVPVVSPEFACDAVGTLVRQTREFCLSGVDRIRTTTARRRAGEVDEFVKRSSRILSQIDSLVAIVRGIESMGELDLVQVTQDVEELRRMVRSVAMSNLAVQN